MHTCGSTSAFLQGSHTSRENKPVFLSIGYSTCHWCHVRVNHFI
ncbi:DUF255 domain-containing protein [Paenibacillus riograndensis]